MIFVDGSEIRHSPFEEKVVYPIFYLQGFIDPRWLAGFLNHQQYQGNLRVYQSENCDSIVEVKSVKSITTYLLTFLVFCWVSIRPPTIVSLLAVYVRLCGWCDEFLQVTWRIDAEYFLWKCTGEPFLHLNGHSEEPQLIIHDIEYWYDMIFIDIPWYQL